MLDGGITHLNLRALPESLRSLYADLILRKLYYSVQSLGEIPRGEVGDHDRFRIFVIVDEAKLLVGEKQGIKAVLNKYATELRKFGVGIILASQLVGHFNDEILANIAVKFCMKAETKRQARENCKYFEFDERQLLTLGQGEGILVSGDDRRKIRIVPSWERDGDDA
jgi:DNA helicase HerA-like ATPase